MAEDLLKEPLPDPWLFGVTHDGRIFFINDDKKITTWSHPDTGQPVRTGFRRREDLPPAWEEGITANGQPYYINHNNQTTTFQIPEKEEKDKSKKQRKLSRRSKDHSYENIPPEPKKEIKRKRRGSSFISRSGINLFRRSSSKAREKPEKYENATQKSENMLREKSEKRPKAARPLSAISVRSSQSMNYGKMKVTWRDPEKQIEKSGWLYKQDSTGKMKMWRKRWFVLADFCLYYYKDSEEKEILGSIVLPSYTVNTLTNEEKVNRKYSFKVEHAGMRTYHFSADSYNDMAQWITALQKSCTPLSLDKSEAPSAEIQNTTEEDSRGESIKGKNRDSSGSRKKKQEDDDSEFGFHHAHTPSSLSSSSHSSKPETVQDKPTISANKSMNNNKYDPEMLQKNGKLPSSEPKITSQSPKRQNHRGMSPDEVVPPPQIARDPYQEQGAPTHAPQRAPPKNEIPRHSQNYQAPQATQNRPSARTAYDKPHMQMRQAPHNQKNVRKENGESAYFSDTSGATDSSRFANSSDRSNTQHPNQNAAQTAVKRQDSIAKLGNWVMNQRMRQQSSSTLNSPQRTNFPSNFDTASEFSSVSQQQPRKSATLSARGPQRLGPPSTRRYRARTYNEYMDPMEVASSTISMPPIQHVGGNRLFATHTLPRPQSIEHVDGSGRHNRPGNNTMDPRRMVSSKSAGNIIAVDQYGVPTSPKQGTHHQDPNHIKRAKSDYVFQNGNDLEQQYLANFAKAQKQNQVVYRAPRQQKYPRPGSASKNSSEPRSTGSASNSSSGGLTPRRSVPKSGGTPKYNDVFSPRSDISSTRGSRKHGQVFHFEDPPSQKGNRKQGQYEGRRGPGVQRNPLSPTSPGDKSGNSSVEVKQIQKGQLRAFVLSARTPKAQLPPPERQTPLKSNDQPLIRVQHPSENENDIEAKLKRLNELDRTLLQISDNMASLQSDKERLEDELSAARSKLHSRYSTGSRESNNQLRDQRQLEEQLSNVKGQLSIVAQKLQDMSEENEEFETEIKKLKTKLIEDLRTRRVMTDDVYNGISDKEKESKRKLEWELGRVEFMMEGLNKQKIGLVNKLNVLNESKADDSPLLSPLSPLSQVSPTSRSPRDVKRMSMERRTSNNRPSNSSASSGSTSNGTPVKKYFTLPGRGISHATSVDSITAESLAKTSPRPTSARSVSSIGSTNSNLHRTKSAAERLFQSNYANHAPEQEAREIKRLQKEIIRNRRNNLKSSSMGDTMPRRHSNPTGMTLPTRSHMKVGIDVQMALKHHRMPKVLQRAKRDMARAEAERLNKEQSPIGFDIDDLDRQVKQQNSGLYEKENYAYNNGSVDSPGHKEVDLEPEEIHLDVNLTHQTTGVVTSSTLSGSVGGGSGLRGPSSGYARPGRNPPNPGGRPERWGGETGDGRVFFSGGGPGTSITQPNGSGILGSVYCMMI